MMSSLEGFRYFDFKDDTPRMHVHKDRVEFSAGVTHALGFPDRCIFLFHDDTKRCAIQAVAVDDIRGVAYYEEDNMPDSENITWHNKQLANEIAGIGGLDLEKGSYVVTGYPLLDEDAVMFDLNSAKPA